MSSMSDTNTRSLLDHKTIHEYLLKDSKWADSHGADVASGFLGSGLLYYTLPYMLRAQLCVCIGSGGGFVPRLMKQAQRDLGLINGKTILIDANAGEWCRPEWLEEQSFFRRQYADVEIIIDRSSNVFNDNETKKWAIDYLHIDGDHSYQGSLEDIQNYTTLMSERGIITFHDTKPYEYFNVTCWKTLNNLRKNGQAVIDFNWLGSGVAIIQLNKGMAKPSTRRMFHKQYIFNFFSTIQRRFFAKIRSMLQ